MHSSASTSIGDFVKRVKKAWIASKGLESSYGVALGGPSRHDESSAGDSASTMHSSSCAWWVARAGWAAVSRNDGLHPAARWDCSRAVGREGGMVCGSTPASHLTLGSPRHNKLLREVARHGDHLRRAAHDRTSRSHGGHHEGG